MSEKRRCPTCGFDCTPEEHVTSGADEVKAERDRDVLRDAARQAADILHASFGRTLREVNAAARDARVILADALDITEAGDGDLHSSR